MDKKNNKDSLSSQGLNYKLRIATCLMAVLPLLVSGYLVSNYILPRVGFKIDVTISIIISIFIAIIGFFLIKEVFDRVLSVSTEAKLIVAGDLSRLLKVERADEVGELGDALNQLTQRIRSNMDELKNYGEKTTEINIEIQRRVIVLSSLLQISSLISQGAKLEDILKLTIEKSRLLVNSEVSFLLFREEGQEVLTLNVADGASAEQLLGISINPKEELFNKVINTNRPLILDRHNTLPGNLAIAFYEKFKLKSAMALPVYLRGRVAAVLAIGDSKGSVVYKKEDSELLDIFAKQIAIAVENDILMHHVERLEIKDTLTGLYNESFMRNRLQEEIRRAIACQRPCAFVLFDIDNFKTYHQSFGSLKAESTLKKVASLIKDSVTEIDRVGRTGDNEFAIIIPEKNKRQAQEIAEDIRKKIAFVFSEESDTNKKITISGGVSENPLDGINAEELIASAKELLRYAKQQGRNRIVSFKEPSACQ